MENNIWSSAQMAGTGGALKALAKNVANRMKLNRSDMKRVVAKVVAERHGLGEVADYKGHMYYVKPDRIDMTQLISESKEAFDDLVQRKGASKQASPSSSAGKRSPTQVKKTSTAMFQLDDSGRKSLNGVIIDETHLPRPGREILLTVHRGGGAKKVVKKKLKSKSVLSVVPTVKSSQRLPAGATYHPPPAKKSPKKLKSKKPSLLQRSYDKPWLVRNIKRHRMAGGKSSSPEKSRSQSPSRRSATRNPVARQLNRVNFPWYTPYQFQGAAGATQRPEPIVQKSKSCLKPKIKSKDKRVKSPAANAAAAPARHKRMQSRLVKDMMREEAIDDPARLQLDLRRKRSKVIKKTEQQQAQPVIEVLKESSPKAKTKSKTKSKSKLPQVSSRYKRLPKPQGPTAAAVPPPRHRRPRRRVPVGSSLGSIEQLRGRGSSQSESSPAKRQLTIAFMSKRMDERQPRTQVPAPWK